MISDTNKLSGKIPDAVASMISLDLSEPLIQSLVSF